MIGNTEYSSQQTGIAGGSNSFGGRLTALSFAVAGICFVLYPAIRPFSDEVSMQGAEAFASTAWLVAHSLAIIGFMLLTVALFGLYHRFREKSALGAWALVTSWVGVGLTLPYYGAEVFGLHAVGQAVVDRQNVGLMSIVNAIRWEAGIYFILIGLGLLGVGTILFAIAIWRSGQLPKWAGIPLAIGFALYIPQFTTTQPIRVAHGLLIMGACWVLAGSISTVKSHVTSEQKQPIEEATRPATTTAVDGRQRSDVGGKAVAHE
jgi:hypothetical protein